mmetsp:Transcript_730/g.1072  ORF Transcript_730/g.1072 Transcript_730/m.1072 type:complete len:117 (-) Transcript_730:189-539(-)
MHLDRQSQQTLNCFTQDKATIEVLSPYLLLTFVVLFFEGNLSASCSIVRCLNKQFMSAVIMVVIYYFLALPLGYYLCFSKELGMKGFPIGLIVGGILTTVSNQFIIESADWHAKAA